MPYVTEDTTAFSLSQTLRAHNTDVQGAGDGVGVHTHSLTVLKLPVKGDCKEVEQTWSRSQLSTVL